MFLFILGVRKRNRLLWESLKNSLQLVFQCLLYINILKIAAQEKFTEFSIFFRYNITVYSMTSNVITDLINTSKAAWRAAGSPYSGMSIWGMLYQRAAHRFLHVRLNRFAFYKSCSLCHFITWFLFVVVIAFPCFLRQEQQCPICYCKYKHP